MKSMFNKNQSYARDGEHKPCKVAFLKLLSLTFLIVVGAFGNLSAADLYVGSNSSGVSLTISSSTNYSNTYIGFSGNSNTLIISGSGVVFSNTVTVSIGVGSDNSLIVSNGAALQSSDISLGDSSTGTNNQLLIDSGGSVSVGSFNVGVFSSFSKVTIQGGGTLTSGNSTLGLTPNASNNSVLINGVGSSWRVDGFLAIGQSSQSNSVTVANGGSLGGVSSPVDIGLGANGSLNVGRLGSNDTAGSIGAGSITMYTSNSSINFNQRDSATLTSSISGVGTLNQLGTGTTTLTGANTYSGATLINAGTLLLNGTHTGGGAYTVNSGGTFGGVGTTASRVIVTPGGKIAPGTGTPGGTLTVGGLTMNTGGIFNVLLGGASTTAISSTGSVSLAGIVMFSTNAPLTGSTYVFLTSSGTNTISGIFDSTNSMPSGYELIYGSNSVYLQLIVPPTPPAPPTPVYPNFLSYAVTPNQRQVAGALNQWAANTPIGDKQIVLNTLTNMTTTQAYQQAFEAIAPTLYQSLSTMAFNAANAQYNDLVQQMFGLRVAGTGFTMSGLGDNIAVLEGQGDKGVLDSKKDILRPGADNHWGMFVDGNGIFAQANSGNMLQNYNAQSGGLIAGLTYKWSPAVATGIYAGYQGTYAKFNGTYSGSTVIDNAVRFGLLATYGDPSGRGFYGDALIGGSYNNYTVTRSITFPGMNRTANSTPGAGELNSLIAAGYNFRKGNWAFGPVSSLQYTYFGMNSFNETGAQSLDYQGLNWNTASMIYNLGGNCAYSWQATRNLMVVPQVNLAWQHEFMQNPYAINGNLGGASVANWSATPLRDSLYTGIGVTLEYKKRWNTAFFYNAAAGNSDLVSQNIFWSAGVKF